LLRALLSNTEFVVRYSSFFTELLPFHADATDEAWRLSDFYFPSTERRLP
jgi:hypothetical protein